MLDYLKPSAVFQRASLDREQRAERNSQNRKALIILVVAAVLAIGWTHNAFDNFLWRVHLNHSDCVQNAFGATFCGDAATNYQNRLRDAGIAP